MRQIIMFMNNTKQKLLKILFIVIPFTVAVILLVQLHAVDLCCSNYQHIGDLLMFQNTTTISYNRPLHNIHKAQCCSYGSYTFSRGAAYYDQRLDQPTVTILFYGPNNPDLEAHVLLYSKTKSGPSLRIPCSIVMFDISAQQRVKLDAYPHWPQHTVCAPNRSVPANILSQITHVQLVFNKFVPQHIITTDQRVTSECLFPLAIVPPVKSRNDQTNSVGLNILAPFMYALVQTDKKSIVGRRLDVCVKAMHSNYSDWMQIVHFTEWWLHAGATHLWVYRSSSSTDVDAVLNYYTNERRVMHVIASSDEHKASNKAEQMIQVQDCNLRLSGQVDFVVKVDWDEYMMHVEPHKNTKSYLLRYLTDSVRKKPNIGGWQWRHVYSTDFHELQKDNDTTASLRDTNAHEIDDYLATLSMPNLHVSPVTSLNYWRTKMIVRPERILVEFVHHVINYTKHEYKTEMVRPQKLLMFHMRRKSLHPPPDRMVPNPFVGSMTSLNKAIGDTVQKIREKLSR